MSPSTGRFDELKVPSLSRDSGSQTDEWTSDLHRWAVEQMPGGTVTVRDGALVWRDGEKIFAYRDRAPLTAGWFAFRTVKSHLEIRHFRVEQPAP